MQTFLKQHTYQKVPKKHRMAITVLNCKNPHLKDRHFALYIIHNIIFAIK